MERAFYSTKVLMGSDRRGAMGQLSFIESAASAFARGRSVSAGADARCVQRMTPHMRTGGEAGNVKRGHMEVMAFTALSAAKAGTAAAAVAAVVFAAGTEMSLLPAAHAVSGGGKDYASQNHANETFHGDFSGKDFSGGLFRYCDFKGANLTSASMFKAELREANLSEANLSYATVEAAILRDTVFENSVMVGAYISDSILEAASIRGADFTDALISPGSVVAKLCNRKDATGVNPTTGVSTRESLMCPD